MLATLRHPVSKRIGQPHRHHRGSCGGEPRARSCPGRISHWRPQIAAPGADRIECLCGNRAVTFLRVVPTLPSETSLAEWLARTWRAYPRTELEAMFSHRQLAEAIESGGARRVAPGIYAGAAHCESTATRIDAATQWAGAEAWIGGAASLFLAGAVRVPPMRVEVVVPAGRRMSRHPKWVRVRRLSYRPPTVRVDGWQVVEPAIAWCQAFSEMAHDERASALCALVAADPSALGTVARAAQELPALRERKRMVAVATLVASGSESYLEVHAVERVFVGHRFDSFLRQHVVSVAGRRYRLDMFDGPTMTAIELDGATYHSGVWEWQRDIRRDADLAAIGILTLRFSYRDLTARPEWCRALALDVLKHRSTPVQIQPMPARTFS